MALVYIGLGANLGNPQQQIDTAISKLAQQHDIELLRRAPLYESLPVGPQDQPNYLNTVVEIDTQLTPIELLTVAKSIEKDMGRTQAVRWSARIIDLDILLYDNQSVVEENLNIPHKSLQDRSFVIFPLADLRPDLRIGQLPPLAEFRSEFDSNECWLCDPIRSQLSPA